MKEKDIREHIQAFLKSTAQNFVVPASMGIGLALVGCDTSPLTGNSDGSIDVTSLQPRTGGATGGNSGAGGTLYGIPTGGNPGTGGMIYGTGGFPFGTGGTAGFSGAGGTVYGTGGLIRTGGGTAGFSGAGGTVYGTGGLIRTGGGTAGFSGAGGTVYGTGGLPRTGGTGAGGSIDAAFHPEVYNNDVASDSNPLTRDTGDADPDATKDALPGNEK